MSGREHMANQVARNVADLAMKVAEKMEQEIGYTMGAEEVGVREVRAAIRDALNGNVAAVKAVIDLVGQQEGSPNPVIREIDAVMREAGYD